MRKLKFYIETSTVNFAVSNQVPAYREDTLAFFKTIRSGIHEAYTSDVVLREGFKSIEIVSPSEVI